MKDDHLDVGNEPNYQSVSFVKSNDVWNRWFKDVFTADDTTHFPPKHATLSGNSNYIYARVRNRSCVKSPTANMHFFWTVANTEEWWQQDWLYFQTNTGSANNYETDNFGVKRPLGARITIIDSSAYGSSATSEIIPPLSALGGYMTKGFAWKAPNPQWYPTRFNKTQGRPVICLMARVESPDDPFYNPGTHVKAWDLAMQNNSVVTLNTYITRVDSGRYKWEGGWTSSTAGTYRDEMTWIRVPNTGETEKTTNISLVFTGEAGLADFTDYGNVYLVLDSGLYSVWQAGGAQGSNVTVADYGWIQLTDASVATLRNLTIDTGTDYKIGVAFDYLGSNAPSIDLRYSFDLGEYETDSLTHTGAPTMFETVVLAEPAAEDSTETELYKNDPAMGITEVLVKNGLSVYPNPATSAATLEFTMGSAAVCDITLSDINGRVIKYIAQNKVLEEGAHKLQADLSGVKPGIYFILLESGTYSIREKIVIKE
ncbi:MAG TPA: T9SS type A sorting domain-containing protein [Bacteroidia bacterium]|nr:T9SS type A sorting domain-containing protein [Bacteroidia bacterium]